MLVLTRKYQEKIRIGDNIIITVLKTKGKAVRLGIEAPMDVSVIRGELSFESDDEVQTTVSNEVEEPVAPTSVPVAGMRRESTAQSAWETRLRRPGMPRKRALRAEVGHQRISREEVANVIPRIVSSNGTLRDLLDQRSAVR